MRGGLSERALVEEGCALKDVRVPLALSYTASLGGLEGEYR